MLGCGAGMGAERRGVAMTKPIAELRRIFADALIDCWHDNKRTRDALVRFKVVSEFEGDFEPLFQQFGIKWIPDKLVRAWVNDNLRQLSDALWDGRKTEMCRSIAVKSLGGQRNGADRIVRVRNADKKHDWSTVK